MIEQLRERDKEIKNISPFLEAFYTFLETNAPKESHILL
jgi:hypothetical protein